MLVTVLADDVDFVAITELEVSIHDEVSSEVSQVYQSRVSPPALTAVEPERAGLGPGVVGTRRRSVSAGRRWKQEG